ILNAIIPPALFFSAPLIFTALGGVFSERSGVVNIGLEGLMVMGAFIAIVFNLTFASALGAWTPWIAMLVASIISGVFSLIHAPAIVSFRVDQVVSGIASYVIALGIGVLITKEYYEKGQRDMISTPFYTMNVPSLSDIPLRGTISFKGV